MIVPLYPVYVPTAAEFSALDAFAELAKARAELVRLYGLLPTASLETRLAATDCVLVHQYESLLARGHGLEAAAILTLHRARHVRMAAERRAA